MAGLSRPLQLMNMFQSIFYIIYSNDPFRPFEPSKLLCKQTNRTASENNYGITSLHTTIISPNRQLA